MRTIIEIHQPQIEAIDAWCATVGISRAEAIRRAIDAHLRTVHMANTRSAFGLWRQDPVDGLAHERSLRAEWEAAPAAPRRPRPRRRPSKPGR